MKVAIVGEFIEGGRLTCIDMIVADSLEEGAALGISIYETYEIYPYSNFQGLDAEAEGIEGIGDVFIDGTWYRENSVQNLGWKHIRKIRNGLLIESDWTHVSDTPLSAESLAAWASYRQELRDVTSTYANPEDVVFPDAPLV